MVKGKLRTRAAEPAEQELREMLESRTRESVAVRRRTSRRLSVLLLVTAAIMAIWFAIMMTTAENPDESALERSAGMPTGTSQAAKTSDGQIIDEGDIRFAMELMQFMGASPEPAESSDKSGSN